MFDFGCLLFGSCCLVVCIVVVCWVFGWFLFYFGLLGCLLVCCLGLFDLCLIYSELGLLFIDLCWRLIYC